MFHHFSTAVKKSSEPPTQVNIDKFLSKSEKQCDFVSPRVELTGGVLDPGRFYELLMNKRNFNDLTFNFLKFNERKIPFENWITLQLHLPTVHRWQWQVICKEVASQVGYFKGLDITGGELFQAFGVIGDLTESEWGAVSSLNPRNSPAKYSFWAYFFDQVTASTVFRWQGRNELKYKAHIGTSFANPIYWTKMFEKIAPYSLKPYGISDSAGKSITLEEFYPNGSIETHSMSKVRESAVNYYGDFGWGANTDFICTAEFGYLSAVGLPQLADSKGWMYYLGDVIAAEFVGKTKKVGERNPIKDINLRVVAVEEDSITFEALNPSISHHLRKGLELKRNEGKWIPKFIGWGGEPRCSPLTARIGE